MQSRVSWGITLMPFWESFSLVSSWNLQSLTCGSYEFLEFHPPTHSCGECVCSDFFAFSKISCSSLGNSKGWVRLSSTSLSYSTGKFCKLPRSIQKYLLCFCLLSIADHIFSVGNIALQYTHLIPCL